MLDQGFYKGQVKFQRKLAMDYHRFAEFFQLDTPTYKLAKFLLKFLTDTFNSSTANEYIVIDSFHFAEEICQQDSNLQMASLDVDFLFTNIHLEEETTNICVDNLYSDNKNPPNIPKHDLHNLFNIDSHQRIFLYV